jgi:signal transduction histidine kinase
MKYIFFISLLFLLSKSNCRAQLLIGDALTKFDSRASYFIDSTNNLSLRQVSKLQFQRNPITSFHFENQNSIWIKIDLEAKKIKQNQFVLGFTQAFIDSVVVYHVSGVDTTKLATSDILNSKRTGFYHVLANPTVSFTVKKNGLNQLFICLRNKIDIIKVNIIICDPESALSEIVSYERLTSMFMGFLIGIFILSMIYFLISRASLYLYYAIYIGSICLYLETVLGNLYIFFPSINKFFVGQNADVMYGLIAVIFNLHFLEKLFGLHFQHSGFRLFKKFIIVIATIFFIYNILTNALPSSLLIPVLLVLLQISVLFFAYNSKSLLYKLFIIGLTPLCIICIIRILALLSIIEQPRGIGGLVLPAVSFELLILMVLQSKVFFDEIKEKNKLKTQVITNQIETQESERRKIAHDLHDDLGSTLSVLKEKIFGVTDNSETQDLINKAIDDLRNISHNLLPADFETFGFIPALEKYIHKLNGIGLKITFIIFGERQILPSSSELNLYRILVEILHNIKKHSQSKEATVQLIYHDTFLYISVETNDQIKKTEEKGNGIGEKSIISRLEYLQARVLEKGDGKNGYSYIFEIPYDQNPNS